MALARAPLWDAVVAYQEQKILPFHTPGHKLSSHLFPEIASVLGGGVFALDPSDELEAPVWNHAYEAVLAEAQNLAAEAFQAPHSFFLANGTTGGIQAMTLFLTGAVLVPRSSHQAVYSGLYLSGSEPIYLPPRLEPEWQIPLPPTPDEFESALDAHRDAGIKTAIVTYPTYHGLALQLEPLLRCLRGRGIQLLVDEAHGAHFTFGADSGFPLPAIAIGADAAVQSAHKSLGCLTQTSLLHCRDTAWAASCSQALAFLQSSSPSMILFAVLDKVRSILVERGRALVSQAAALAVQARQQLAAIPGVDVLPRGIQADPTKLVFSLSSRGLSGIEIEQWLRRDYGIQVELSDYQNVLALVTLADTPNTIACLVAAVRDLAARRHLHAASGLPRSYPLFPPLPDQVLPMRTALAQKVELAALEHAAGRVSAQFLTPYPPGIPLVVPGERMTREILDYVCHCQAAGWTVRGLEQRGLRVCAV